MSLVARVLGVSLATSLLVTVMGLVLLRLACDVAMSSSVYIIPAFLLACVEGMIGAVAGAANEVVSAQRRKAADWSRYF